MTCSTTPHVLIHRKQEECCRSRNIYILRQAWPELLHSDQDCHLIVEKRGCYCDQGECQYANSQLVGMSSHVQFRLLKFYICVSNGRIPEVALIVPDCDAGFLNQSTTISLLESAYRPEHRHGHVQRLRKPKHVHYIIRVNEASCRE